MSELVAKTAYPLQTKEDLIQAVRDWTTMDSKLKIVNEKTRTLRDMKNATTTQIHDYLNSNNLNYKSITISDGELKICDKREYGALTLGYVEGCLRDVIHNADQVEYIMKHIREKRDVKVSRDIRRIYRK